MDIVPVSNLCRSARELSHSIIGRQKIKLPSFHDVWLKPLVHTSKNFMQGGGCHVQQECGISDELCLSEGYFHG